MKAQPGQPAPAPPAQRAHPGVTVGNIATLLGAELFGPPAPPIDGPESLEHAGPRHITFIRAPEFARRWAASRAAAAVVTRGIDVPGHDPSARALLLVPDADLAMIRILEFFAPPIPAAEPGAHPTALVDPTAQLGPRVSLGPYATVGPDSRVGAGTTLGAGVRIGRAVRIGEACTLHPGVVVQDRCTIGDHCILHPGVVVGADGFGYRPGADGQGLRKIPHIGAVEIGSHVEIGANSCIDRAKFGATTIGDGTKIDNLVQIGHNCRIGRSCIICGLAGLAGSVTLGDGVIIAGQVGISDHTTIGAGARIGPMSGVKGQVPAGESWMGAPARPAPEQMRIYVAAAALPERLKALRRLETIVQRHAADQKPAP